MRLVHITSFVHSSCEAQDTSIYNSMIIDWSMQTIIDEVSKISYAEKDTRATGYETWGCKQDLYQIKWLVEHKLEQCSTYVDEQEYVRKHDIKQTFKALSK